MKNIQNHTLVRRKVTSTLQTCLLLVVVIFLTNYVVANPSYEFDTNLVDAIEVNETQEDSNKKETMGDLQEEEYVCTHSLQKTFNPKKSLTFPASTSRWGNIKFDPPTPPPEHQ